MPQGRNKYPTKPNEMLRLSFPGLCWETKGCVFTANLSPMLFYGSLWPVHMADSSLTASSGSGSVAVILGMVDKEEENKD